MNLIFEHERMSDFLLVEDMLIEQRLILDPLDMPSDHPCRLVNYFIEPGVKFHCLLDRNVVSYLIEMVRGRALSMKKKDFPFRYVCGLQAFLNAADIVSEPSIAYHEYLDKADIVDASSDLALFRTADNLNANQYLDIFLGQQNGVSSLNVGEFDKQELVRADLAKKLKIFETNIVYVKKALVLKAKGLSDYQVILELFDWIYDDYLFSSPAFHFLSIYFSAKRLPKMLKSHSIEGVRNATWDLCLLQQLIKCVQSSDGYTRWLLSTFDRAIHETAGLVFRRDGESVSGYQSRLERNYAQMWGRKNNYGSKLLQRLDGFENKFNDEARNIVKHDGSVDYILKVRKQVDDEFNGLL